MSARGVKSQTKRILNRRARFDYELGEVKVVGIQLTGAETKSLRLGHGQLQGAYVTVKDNELWLVNATISPSSGVPITESGQTRSRKLLAKRNEISSLITQKKAGLTIVPIELLTTGRFIKLKIAMARGKKSWDKREVLKKRQQQRDIDREARN
ncbi:SsrA-binding protein [Candidatus Saccharibacteria bacterium RIFCSPHIGHO2_12_FULL_49_19]|nr:MAG: SsrA-binding protein [Candidatus Saccharibacteria bacterium RIFCSPHIGHO2_01_FULL_49_21]OGL36247.1 MAG: SsrA-binding protein [Candidatus Saccharibacteria bacterium RIFCSPHIGHO2_12_FULL_49_19]OGL37348.1 MAG: SsrA-binding protein [Candidatus Saccharibacteria bacterium RIFCSPLOWO2_01_FULL_49_22]